IVGRVLAAMETAGAAVRKPATTDDGEPDPAGAELWVRGDADLITVDLTAAAVRVVCPTCQRPMPRRTGVAVIRTGPVAPGPNSDGQRPPGKNELRTIVRDFLAAPPGHEFTPTTISREIGRSSGAIGNALDKLVISGEAILVKDAPRIYMTPADTDGAKAPTGKCRPPAGPGTRTRSRPGSLPTPPGTPHGRPHVMTDTEHPTAPRPDIRAETRVPLVCPECGEPARAVPPREWPLAG